MRSQFQSEYDMNKEKYKNVCNILKCMEDTDDILEMIVGVGLVKL